MGLYLPFKAMVQSAVQGVFPDHLSKRFTYRMDDEIWIAKEDESVWKKKKAGEMSCNVLFDGIHIAEIPPQLDQKRAVWWILNAFRDAIKDGRINVTKIAEFTDNAAIRRNKRNIEKKKKQALEDAIKEAITSPMNEDELRNMLKDRTAKAKKAQDLVAKREESESDIV